MQVHLKKVMVTNALKTLFKELLKFENTNQTLLSSS